MGTIALSGGEATWADIAKDGPSLTIAYVPPADALLVGTLPGLRGFIGDFNSLDTSSTDFGNAWRHSWVGDPRLPGSGTALTPR